MDIKAKQKRAIEYYDKFSKFYDLISSKSYYHKARFEAIKRLSLSENSTVLNVPVGTGQNFEYFQQYLNNTGLIIGIDLSPGMLEKAKNKVIKNNWNNIKLVQHDASKLNKTTINEIISQNSCNAVDGVLCDLGLSGFPHWQDIIDNLVSILRPGGRIVIMDWYIPKPSLRGEFIKWIGKGEVNRPLWQYLETKVSNFDVNSTFNRGGVFVASGSKNSDIFT